MGNAMDTTEAPHEFADFNAKLAVLDVLCFELAVLAPYGEDDDVVDDDDAFDDPSGDDPSDEVPEDRVIRARAYYDDLDVMPSHLAMVTELTVGDDLEIFQSLHPGWDGSDDRYLPQNWDDIVELPALQAVYAESPLPQHAVDRLLARGVEFRSA